MVWLPDADAMVNPAESFKDRQASVLNEVCFTSYQEEIIVQDLRQTTSKTKLAKTSGTVLYVRL